MMISELNYKTVRDPEDMDFLSHARLERINETEWLMDTTYVQDGYFADGIFKGVVTLKDDSFSALHGFLLHSGHHCFYMGGVINDLNQNPNKIVPHGEGVFVHDGVSVKIEVEMGTVTQIRGFKQKYQLRSIYKELGCLRALRVYYRCPGEMEETLLQEINLEGAFMRDLGAVLEDQHLEKRTWKRLVELDSGPVTPRTRPSPYPVRRKRGRSDC